MRFLALSIVVFSGAIMAAFGTVAESMPDARRSSIVDEWGLGLVIVAGILLMAELYLRLRSPRQDDGSENG
jgi:NADH:ubiquinone oxidoreductase subunit 6 (subunit J)